MFAGGDAVPATRSVTVGIGHGKTAARNIDEWLRHPDAPRQGAVTDTRTPVAFGALDPWYFSDAPHAMRPRLDAARRVADFTEVVGGHRVQLDWITRRCDLDAQVESWLDLGLKIGEVARCRIRARR